MSRLARQLAVWGPCIWLATVGGLFDFYTGVWGPGLILGALIGFAAGRQRLRSEEQDRELRARASDGLNGLLPPEDLDDWELEDEEVDQPKRPGD